mgnify:CR=1 FL=1
MSEREEIMNLTREIATLSGTVRTFIETQEKQTVELFGRLNTQAEEGCALGREHGRRLEMMESRLVKAVYVLLGMLLIQSGIISKDIVAAWLK